MKLKKITLSILVIAIIGSITCIYTIDRTQICAYCREQKNGYVVAPFCDNDYMDLKEAVDSLIVGGKRINQKWECEIK